MYIYTSKRFILASTSKFRFSESHITALSNSVLLPRITRLQERVETMKGMLLNVIKKKTCSTWTMIQQV